MNLQCFIANTNLYSFQAVSAFTGRFDTNRLSTAKQFTHPKGKQFTHLGVRIEYILV
jgi:hypothetical protein